MHLKKHHNFVNITCCHLSVLLFIFLLDAEMPEINTALMEAKKWLKEKKSGSSPGLDLDSTVSPHVSDFYFTCYLFHIVN